MSRSFNAEEILLTIDTSIENVKKYLQVSHSNSNGQFNVFVRNLGLFQRLNNWRGLGNGAFFLNSSLIPRKKNINLIVESSSH